MSDLKIYDKSDLRKYRTETPNTVVKGKVSKNLSVYAKFFYVYLKSVAGENGECWQSTKTLSEGTGMAAGTISKCKKELAENKLIKIDKGDHKKGKSDVITIVDIWGKNMLEYATGQTPSSDEHPPSPHERTPSSDESTCSPDEPKKEPYNQERTLEESARASPVRLEPPKTVQEVEKIGNMKGILPDQCEVYFHLRATDNFMRQDKNGNWKPILNWHSDLVHLHKKGALNSNEYKNLRQERRKSQSFRLDAKHYN